MRMRWVVLKLPITRVLFAIAKKGLAQAERDDYIIPSRLQRIMPVNFRISGLSLLALLVGNSSFVYGNAMTVIGNSRDAEQCYTTAKLAQQPNMQHLSDTESCNLALKGALTRRDRAATMVNRGLIHAAMKNFDEALQDYDEAVEIYPGIIAVTLINRGNTYYMQRDFENALDSYSEAIAMQVKPMHVAIHNQAMVFEKLGDLDAAEAGFVRALELVEGWESAQLRLERVRRKQQALK